MLALFAAGCGGDDEEALSKPEYVKQGNAICAKFNKDIEADSEKAFEGIQSEKDLTPEAARTFFEAALPKFDATLDDLKELKAPEGDEDTVAKIYEAGEKESDQISEAMKDDAEVKALVTSDSVTPEFEKLSKDYGLDTCASS
jgi:hypothetical protein